MHKRLAELTSEMTRLEADLGETKRQETNQYEIVKKAQRGESLAALATRYREAAGQIRSRAAIQLRKRISEHVGDLWIEITEHQREFDRDWGRSTVYG